MSHVDDANSPRVGPIHQLDRRRVLRILGAGAGAGALGLTAHPAAAGPRSGSAPADLVLHSGTVWTGVPHAPDAEAVAVSGRRIVAVGPNRDVLAWAGNGTRVVDLDGAFVAPGFRDQHTHLLNVADGGADAQTYRPVWDGYDEEAAFEGRRRVGQGHIDTLAEGHSPVDEFRHGTVDQELIDSILRMHDEAAKQGVTTVVEAGLTDLRVLDALFQLAAEDRLKVRHLVRVRWGAIERAAQLGWTSGYGNEWVKILGVKMYADGWLGPRTSALREPYNDDPYDWDLPHGVLFLAQQRADADVARARELGFNITTHAIGDLGIQTMLNAYDKAGVTPADRWCLEHVQVAGDDLLDRMADRGVVGSIQLSFPTTDHRFAESALGRQRTRQESYRWDTMRKRGLTLAGGTDFNVEVLDPLWGLQRSVTRQEFDDSPTGGFVPNERVTVHDGLRLITADCAYASFEEDERGTVEPGKYADLVVTRENLLTQPRDCLAAATRLMTVTNGKITFEGAVSYPPGDATCSSGRSPGAHQHP
ncbi:putative amidohydrolase YtcJ [Haloactinopolyspora alba]|uniref:Putative amidohydrolase YtcJ n=1 Tax=Haloactinopolyspora alba TaxID=648780 RepID=A0A2P8DPS1_9ACTN|nr:amidohydrolase family protein [Haloactinopolyspora alba]PSK99208.1 putative amidohydrolase YtcJ [Haloactinopolyspora alba]